MRSVSSEKRNRVGRTIGNRHVARGLAAISLALAGMNWATERHADAQTLTWDASGSATSAATVTDGSGNWDATSAKNWFSGSSDSVWTNGDSAVFGNNNGAAGTVTINDPSGAVSVGTITFNAASSGNYVIAASAGDSLNLSATNSNPLISVASGVSATISAPIGGSFNSYSTTGSTITGLVIKGLGTLTLTGSSTFSGSAIISNNGTNLTGTEVVLDGSINTSGNLFLGQSNASGEADTSQLVMNTGSSITTPDLILEDNFAESTISNTAGSTLTINGSDVINTNEIQIDAGRNSGNTKGGFGAIVLASGANLTLNGQGGPGNSLGTLDIANYSYETGGATGTGINGSVDFSQGTVSGTISTINVATGKAGSGSLEGNTSGTFFFGNGSLDVSTLNVARLGSQPSIGTVTLVSGSTGTITAGAINIGPSAQGTQGSGTTANGVINILGGTLDLTGSITANPNGVSRSITSTINLNGGVLNMNNNAISDGGSSVVILNAASGTLMNLQSLNGNGSLTTTGVSGQTLLLAGSNTYTGGTVISGGLVVADGGAAIGQANSGPLTVNAGVLDLAGFSQTFTGLGGTGGTITNNGGSPLSLTFTNGNTATFAGSISDGTSPISLAVTGGTVSLSSTSSAQTYSGATSISGGASLIVANYNSHTAVTDYGNFAAAGTVGSILVDQGGTLTPGTVTSGGTGVLHGSSVTIGSGGGNLSFFDNASAANPTAFDQLVDSGAFTLNGNLNVNVMLPGTALSGTFALVTAGGGLVLNGNSISPNITIGGGGQSRLSATLNDTSTQIDLIVNGNPANLTWTGAADATTWNIDNTKNWTSTALTNPNVFFQFDNVTFDNTAPTTADTVNLTQAVEPSTVTFNNNGAHNYVVNGSGIADSGQGTTLTMNGSGTVTLNNSNSYAGATNVNAGELVLGSGSIGGSALVVGSVASVVVNSTGSVVSAVTNVGGALTDNGSIGGGTFTVSGVGTATIANNGVLNSTDVVVSGGSLTVQSGGNFNGSLISVAANSSLIVQSGGNVNNNPNLLDNGAVSLAQGENFGSLSGSAATAVVSVNGTITVNGSGTFAGAIADAGVGSPASLNLNGSASLILTGSNTFSGGLNVNGGTTLQLGNGGTTGSINPSLSVSDNGTVVSDLSGNGTFPNPLQNGGAFQQLGGGTLTLTGNNNNFSGTLGAFNGTIVQDPNNPNTLGNGSENLVLGTPGNGSGTTATGNIVLSALVTATNVNTITASNSSLSATPTADLLVVPAGVALTSNSITVGFATTGSTISTVLTLTGGGSLGVNSINTAGGNAYVDLSGLNSVTVNGGNINGSAENVPLSVITLANTTVNSVAPSNVLNLGNLYLGSVSTGAAGGDGILYLGSGTNTISTGNIVLGNGRGYGAIEFIPGAPSSASVTITGNPSVAMCEFTNNGAPGTGQSLLSLAGYNANVQLGSITMAENNDNISGAASAAITFDTGTFTCSNVTMAIDNGGTSSTGPIAAITIGGSTPNNAATGSFTSGGIVLGDFTNTNSLALSAVAMATLNVNGGTATIQGNITNNSTQGTTVSTLNLAGGTLNMSGNSIGNNGGVNSGNGPVAVNLAPVAGETATLMNLGGSGINGNGFEMDGAGTIILAGSNTFSGTTAADSGTTVISAVSALPTNGTVTVGTTGTSGKLQLGHGIGAVTVASLTVNTGSTLDVTNNPLFINYSGNPDPVSMIASYLADGFKGNWASGEITSSSVATANVTQSHLIYSIGYADGADGVVNGLSSGTIEVLPTLAGDAKLAGSVVFGDFQLLAANFGSSAGWDGGNFTYGSVVNFGDFQLLAQNFGASASNLTSAELSSLNGFAAEFGDKLVPNSDGAGFQIVSVPEPATGCLMLLAGAAGLLGRRKRRR